LDIKTLTVLEEFLESYEGCVIIVSHDRFFMDKLVDHCFIFEGNGIVKDFPGNYTDYRESVDFIEAQNEAKKSKNDSGKSNSSESKFRSNESGKDVRNFVGESTESSSSDTNVSTQNLDDVQLSSNVKPAQLVGNLTKSSSNQRKLSFKEKFELDTIEKELPQLQERRSSLEMILSSNDSDYEKILQITKELSELNEKIDIMEFRWLELSEG